MCRRGSEIRRRKRDAPDRGTVLVASLLISVLVAAWIAVAVGSTLSRRNMERSFSERNQARLLAESGLALAVYLLDTQETPVAEHTEDVLRELGKSDADIERLAKAGCFS